MADRLIPYAFGALHAALILFLVVVLVVSAGGSLSGIGTVPGVLIGAWLAALSWAATGWALRGASLEAADRRRMLERAVIAGACAGAAFVAGAFLGTLVAARVFEPASLVFLVLAMPFAGAIGTIVAALLAALDVGIYGLVTRTLTK